MDSNIDYDDHLELAKHCDTYDYLSRKVNSALERMSDLEVELNLGIIEHGIKDSITWKKQILELIKKNSLFKDKYVQYNTSKTEASMNRNLLKALETRINCIKKKINSMPQM